MRDTRLTCSLALAMALCCCGDGGRDRPATEDPPDGGSDAALPETGPSDAQDEAALDGDVETPEADVEDEEEELPPPTSDEWTLLVYMAAAAEMEVGAGLALSWLEEATAGGGDMVHVYVLEDLESTEGTTIYHIEDGVTTVVEEREEENTADPSVLERFVADGLSTYHAERTALFIKGLGYGWRGMCLDRTGPDTFDLMYVDAMADALLAAQDAAGVGLDMVVLEASIMAMIEVVWELREVTSVLLTTETKIQEQGLPYGRIVTDLMVNPSLGVRGFAETIIADHNAFYEEAGAIDPGDERATNFAAMAAHDLSEAEALFDAHSLFAAELGACLPHVHNVVPHARDRSMVGGFGSITESDYPSDIVALITQLTELLEEDGFDYAAHCPGLPAAMEGFLLAYDRFLIFEQHADKFRWVTHGLTVWYPPTDNKYELTEVDGSWIEGLQYEDVEADLDFVLGPDAYWVDYLQTYYRAVHHGGE